MIILKDSKGVVERNTRDNYLRLIWQYKPRLLKFKVLKQ